MSEPLKDVRPALLAWFDVQKRDLPWRRSRDPYAIWVSEVMLQQTQVTTVIPYWCRFMDRFPTLPSLAAASLPEVLSLWRGLGYYARARNLHRAAKEILSRFAGALPSDPEALSSLPGFGRYTTGAVASIAFGREIPIVDGNVARVLSRLFEVDGAPGDSRREKKLWRLAAELVMGERPGDFNQALMELGALICRAENPSCLLCPVRNCCSALDHGRVDELPLPRARAARKHLKFAVAVYEKDGSVLLGMRDERGLFGGLWELPSAELTARSGPSQVTAALGGALGTPVLLEYPLGSVRRTLTHRELELELYRVTARSQPRPGARYQEFRWVAPGEAGTLGMSTAMQRALETAAIALRAR